MKKILLIGEFNNLLENLNMCLTRHFDVQLCSESIELIKGMLKISRPDLVIVCCTEIDDINTKIFMELVRNNSNINTLVIGTKDECNKYREYLPEKRFMCLTRPVGSEVIINKCKEVLFGTDKDEGVMEKINDSKKNILIIDDSALMLRNTKSLLENKYNVSVSISGEQALKLMEKKQPDLILLDYDMPGWNGKVTFEKIREIPEYKDIPIIFLTGIADKEHITAVLHLNPAGYILKPISSEKLLSTIANVIK
ncbi:MAG: response regulator [Lachnospiraceae bacterium]|nr:response regulator [Lachnospiraceae bacterium]